MTFCHGNGSPEMDGCCWVDGAPCPLRIKIVDGSVVAPNGNTIGKVGNYVAEVHTTQSRRAEALEQLQGVTYACRAAVEVLATDPSLRRDRGAFEEAWNSHPDYVAQVRPHWEELEERLGLNPGSYQCSTWTGTGRPQCCFAETPETNEQRARGLAASAVAIRRKGERRAPD